MRMESGMTAIKQERATVHWKTSRALSAPGRPTRPPTESHNCESLNEAVVYTMEKLLENERRRAVIRTASGQPYDFDLIELIYDGIKKART
jgi:hypothetical protein